MYSRSRVTHSTSCDSASSCRCETTMPLATPPTETFRKGQGYRFTVDNIANIGMPGKLPGRPIGGGLRIHPANPGVPGLPRGAPPVPDEFGVPPREPARRHGVLARPLLGGGQAAAAAALRQAAHDGDEAGVAALLQQLASTAAPSATGGEGAEEEGPAVAAVDVPNPHNGRTALMEAVAGDHLEVVRQLLEGGASVDVQDSRGATALALACERGRTMGAAALLRAGADATLPDEEGATPLIRAAEAGRRELVETLLAGEPPPPLPRPAAEPPSAAQMIDLEDRQGRSAAVAAAQKGRRNVLRLLVERVRCLASPRCLFWLAFACAALALLEKLRKGHNRGRGWRHASVSTVRRYFTWCASGAGRSWWHRCWTPARTRRRSTATAAQAWSWRRRRTSWHWCRLCGMRSNRANPKTMWRRWLINFGCASRRWRVSLTILAGWTRQCTRRATVCSLNTRGGTSGTGRSGCAKLRQQPRGMPEQRYRC
jgi:hypothetical protein